MMPLEFPLLLDENIHPRVDAELRRRGLDVQSVIGAGLRGSTDEAVLAYAVAEGRVVVTHDSDFGTLAVRSGKGLVGIVYLRPGHIQPGFVLEMVDIIRSHEVEPPTGSGSLVPSRRILRCCVSRVQKYASFLAPCLRHDGPQRSTRGAACAGSCGSANDSTLVIG